MTTGYLVHTNAYDAWMMPDTGTVISIDRDDHAAWSEFLYAPVDLGTWCGSLVEPGFDPHEQGVVLATRDDTEDRATIHESSMLYERELFHFGD